MIKMFSLVNQGDYAYALVQKLILSSHNLKNKRSTDTFIS